MTKKNEKRLCWNCDGSVSQHLEQCPYCGVDVTQIPENPPFASPFQASPQIGSTPKPPYNNSQNFDVSRDEWNRAIEEGAPGEEEEEELISHSSRKEMIALLLLLPGIVFFLFGLVLMLFASEGKLTLQWNQSFAYFYFLGAVPLLLLGWRALR